MFKNLPISMEIPHQRRQQQLGRRTLLFGVLAPVLLASMAVVLREASAKESPRVSFAVALPELEGPVTFAIFAPSGSLARLLYRDAAVDEIPAGLNGLLMTWDGNDSNGEALPPGPYRGRGLVHGPLSATPLPPQEIWRPLFLRDGPADPASRTFNPFPRNRITVRAARDELLETRPLLAITARIEGNRAVVEAEGLPLFSLPVEPSGEDFRLTLSHGQVPGTARLEASGANGTASSYLLSGLDRLVPLNAGVLELDADPSRKSASAGEANP